MTTHTDPATGPDPDDTTRAGDDSRSRFSLLGMAIAACVACCLPPLLLFLAGLGVFGLLSTVVLGAGGMVIACVALVAFVAVRRRQRSCPTPSGSEPVSSPTRRR